MEIKKLIELLPQLERLVREKEEGVFLIPAEEREEYREYKVYSLLRDLADAIAEVVHTEMFRVGRNPEDEEEVSVH